MTIKKLFIIGCGGFGREIRMTLQIIQDVNNFEILGFLDDNEKIKGNMINDLKVLGGVDMLQRFKFLNTEFIISIGDPTIRKKIALKLDSKYNSYSVIHPFSVLSNNAKTGKGLILQQFSSIMPNTKIGNYVHVNFNSAIAHDSIIGDYTTISPGCFINGNTTIGNNCFIGSGVITKPGITIGNNSIVGAGSIVISDIPKNTLFVGNPAKFKKRYPL